MELNGNTIPRPTTVQPPARVQAPAMGGTMGGMGQDPAVAAQLALLLMQLLGMSQQQGGNMPMSPPQGGVQPMTPAAPTGMAALMGGMGGR